MGGWRRISPKLYNQIPESDVRKGWFLDDTGVSVNLPAAAQAYITKKGAPVYTQVKYGPMNDEWGSNNNATDVILMRVEEMYLIKAEAQAMNNDVSGGVNTLNSFVNTYRDPSYKCTATTGEAVQEAVWHQRRIEFWGEGLAYFDIMRLNKGVNRLGCGFPKLRYLTLLQVIRSKFTVSPTKRYNTIHCWKIIRWYLLQLRYLMKNKLIIKRIEYEIY